ncbi:MAG: AAA family ATPase [Veillonella sp.]|mgnify:FL=1|jgi:hypothetical protein|nr:AAA family ATPase [Veillonella sp.]
METNNFSRLKYIDSDLYKLATESEKYLYSDHQSVLFKLRLFGEYFVKYIYNDLRLPNNPRISFCDRLQQPDFCKAVPTDISDKLNVLRVYGNKAAHQVLDHGQDSVNHCLKEAYLLGKWLYFKMDPNALEYPEFILPEKVTTAPIIESINLDAELKSVFDDPDGTLAKQNKLYQDIDSETRYEITEERAKEYTSVIEKHQIELYPEETRKHYRLLDEYIGYELTSGQKKLVEELESFINNDSQHIFLLKGYAGTGKTFILKGLVNYLRSIGRSSSLSAPTGKAALVLREKTGKVATTVHSMVYSLDQLEEYGENKESETFKLIFQLKDNENPTDHVYLIDESSLLSNAVNDNEFIRFGSGRLLDDLMHFINLDSNDHKKKVIFIGDDAQLAPVKMDYSPALAKEYFVDIYGSDCPIQEFKLTEVVRQKASSLILKNALRIRDDLSQDIFNQLSIEQDDSEVISLQTNQFLNAYMMNCDNRIDEDSIVIASKNDTVCTYNKLIREALFPEEEEVVPGDRIMFTKNTFIEGKRVYNGEFATIVSVGEVEKRVISLNKDTQIPLNFRSVEIEFINEAGIRTVAWTLLIEDLLASPNSTLTTDEQKALYRDFCIRNGNALTALSKKIKEDTEDSNGKSNRIKYINSNERLQIMKDDRYFNAVQAKYGYAITCHKAQGSEWKTVFLDPHYYQNILSANGFRWLYTGLTRASDKLYLINWSDITVDSSIKLDELNVDDVRKELEAKLRKQCDVGLHLGFEIDSLSGISRGICEAIVRVLPEESCIVSSVVPHDYHDIYTIYIGGSIEKYRVYYNGKRIISRILPDSNNNTNHLESGLNTLVGTLISCDSTQHNAEIDTQTIIQNARFQAGYEEFLQSYSQALAEKLSALDIKIGKIECKPFCVRYTFVRGNGSITLDIYYNGKKRFSSTKFIEKLCNDSGLSADIKTILENGVSK